MYEVLDKKRLCTGSIMGLDLVAFKPTTNQMTNCHFECLNNLRHNQQHKLALTENPYIASINVTYNRAEINGAPGHLKL